VLVLIDLMMSIPFLEIYSEFGVILLAPLVFQFVLWRSKEGRESRMFRQNFVIFGVLYMAIFGLALINYISPLKPS
jgi:drug/metabolite transporter (DMT)-like permease